MMIVVFNYFAKENQNLRELSGEVALPGPKGRGTVRLGNNYIYNFVLRMSYNMLTDVSQVLQRPSLHLTGS